MKHRIGRILNAQLNFLGNCISTQQRRDNQRAIESRSNAGSGDQVAVNHDSRPNGFGASRSSTGLGRTVSVSIRLFSPEVLDELA